MKHIKETNFFKVSKKLIQHEDFKNLNPSSRLIIIYLLCLTNSFNQYIFWQKPISFAKELGFSKMTIWRCKEELQKMGIVISQKGQNWEFNMVFFFDKYTDHKVQTEDIVTNCSNIVTKSFNAVTN